MQYVIFCQNVNIGFDEMKKKLKGTPHLYNLNADPQMTYVITHLIEKGQQYLIGKPGDKTNIAMAGAG